MIVTPTTSIFPILICLFLVPHNKQRRYGNNSPLEILKTIIATNQQKEQILRSKQKQLRATLEDDGNGNSHDDINKTKTEKMLPSIRKPKQTRSKSSLVRLRQSMEKLNLSHATQEEIVKQLTDCGLIHDWLVFAKDFSHRPELLSSLLQSDFSFSPLLSHQTRAAMINGLCAEDEDVAEETKRKHMKTAETKQNQVGKRKKKASSKTKQKTTLVVRSKKKEASRLMSNRKSSNESTTNDETIMEEENIEYTSFLSSSTNVANTKQEEEDEKKSSNYQQRQYKNFKSVVVNDQAKKRHDDATTTTTGYEFGLPRNFHILYPKIAVELEHFIQFMTLPSIHAQEQPIRLATANVYVRHAKLFLGWYVHYSRQTQQERQNNNNNKRSHKSEDRLLSIFTLIPNKDRESANVIIDFILWMRHTRKIAISYEANLLRGIIKLLKFRFARESHVTDTLSPSSSFYHYRESNTFDDIPIIQEIRKLHRDANRQQLLTPRSSKEDLKWLSWPEYLSVVQNLKSRVEEMIDRLKTNDNENTNVTNDHGKLARTDAGTSKLQSSSMTTTFSKTAKTEATLATFHDKRNSNENRSSRKEGISAHEQSVELIEQKPRVITVQERKIAITFQKYLILAIFAYIPDRQRTIRELEIGRTFVKNMKEDCWCIKHSPDDYKTGKVYGERPPLLLSNNELTSCIDYFIETWRPCLFPYDDNTKSSKSKTMKANNIKTTMTTTTLKASSRKRHSMLFVQPKTGNPLTQNSVYQIVVRSCFEQTGKRTNPHLLRDMIVTHIREESDASEQQLEALALFMGHSIQMQRKSYDRRTLQAKVAPAMDLLESVNNNKQS